ncbi:TAXI family TRAP transporter solute-binding subunit [Calditrichota bacterium]
MRRFAAILTVLAISIVLVSCGGGTGPKTHFVTIGTGGVTGVYYPTGGALAKMINDKSEEYHIKATVQATGGSVFNVNSIMAGDLDFGIAQSDIQFQAFNGVKEWEGNPQKGLRSIFSLHTEVVTVIASEDSKIESVTDMRDKVIAIGNPGSGNRANALDALWSADMTIDDIHAEDLKPAECAGMLQDGRIDAYFYTVGHPNGSIKEAVAGKEKVHFVPLVNAEKLIAKFPYYAIDEIDISHYEGVTNEANVPTFGVKATFVTSSKVSEDVVYAFTKEVFENFDKFKTLHPAFGSLTKEKMMQGLTAPLHPGAKKYFMEQGLVE